MSDKPTGARSGQTGAAAESMTPQQAEDLRRLCQETGEGFDPALDREAAHRRIRDLERRLKRH